MPSRPKPTALKLVTGNPGKRPLNKYEPQIPPGIPDPPDGLAPDALEEWHRIAVPLYNLGILTKYDRAALTLYCETWGYTREARKKIAELGITIETKSGNIIQNPAVGAYNKAGLNCIKYAIELGLTPSARSRISTQGLNARAAQETNAFAEFVG